MRLAYRILLLILIVHFSGQASDNRIQHAIQLYQKGDFEKAKLLFDKLLEERSRLSTEEQIQIYNNLGNIYADQGKNAISLSYYQKALYLSKLSKRESDQGKILKNIGALHVSWKKFAAAEEYYKNALEAAKRNNDSKLIADCYNNLGTVYEQINKLDKAKKSYFEALNYYQKKKSDLDIAMVYSNLAIVLKSQNKLKSSIEYNTKALLYAKKGNDLWMSAAISNNIGNAYSIQGNYALGEKYGFESVVLSKQINAIEITIMAYETLAHNYERQGDFNRAYQYSKKMIQLNNDFINANQIKQFSELEVKYNTKEKEFQNEKLRFEKERIQKQNNFNISIFSLIFLVVIVFVIAYFQLKKQKLLTKKQREMNHTVLESETQERFRIARDLHDSVGQMLAVIKMHLSANTENDSLSTLVDKTITEVRQISHNLIPEALNFGLKRALEELVEKSQIEGQITIYLDFQLDKSQLQLSKEKELMLFRIIQELIGNTLKHANASQIRIALSLEKNRIRLQFSENGIGFDVKELEESNGLGWKNTQARLALLDGEMEISSQINNGSTILILLPNV